MHGDIVTGAIVTGAYHLLRARRALMWVKDVPLKTRRVLSHYKVYDDSTLLIPNCTHLAFSERYVGLQTVYHILICFNLIKY